MRSFYHFMMRYRGNKESNDQKKLADWMVQDHDFPKHSTSYDEISRYLEWNIPFPAALSVFDGLWEEYQENEIE